MATEAVLNEQAQVDKGDNARLSSFVGAIAIADLVKTTLGPKGMDKILQSMGSRDGSVSVTNDGATILRAIHVDNAAAKVLVDIAKTQDDEVGDGTTSVTVLCGELLREAEQLVNARLHPQTIIQGWRLATAIARKVLVEAAEDNAADAAAFRADLMNIARTTLSSKLVTHEKHHFAELAVDAVLRLKGSGNLDYIQIIKKPGGSLRESYLEEGFILDKKIGVGQPRRIENAKILVANTSMDTDKIKIYGSRVRVDSMAKVAEIEEAEREKMRKKCKNIIDHGVNVFVNRQLIYNFPEQIFAEAGVMAIEHADFEGVERLAAVTGAAIASTFEHPELAVLGECKVIEEVMIGEDSLIRFSGCKAGEACTIVLRGASEHVLDEAERSLHDALCVLTQTIKETRTVPGGGCMEVAMAQAIDAEVPSTAGKRALAMEAYARALRQLPTIIADNGGYDSSELVTQLRAAHAAGQTTAGLDMYQGKIADMNDLGVRESYKSKLQVLVSAAEAAEMILRVDDIIRAAPRQRGEH
ncbi:chaperonin Cpn60/TCP-1 family [Tribonema minus]|uniref:CCT-beta n=1 Tax=Tribonema minus TaxID=303371 RepID=A0A836CDN2_9STRA|nr:chaperonin Cpn60/TCP-1 family [Tribonema minus]